MLYVADGMVAMTVTEFDCLDVYYKWWKDDFKGRLVVCKECGELFIAPVKSPAKQCEECYKRKHQESKNEYLRNKR